MDKKQAIDNIAKHYGLPNQLAQLTEECAEAIVAVNKMRRAKTGTEYEKAVKNFIEEVADVEIMCRQMHSFFDSIGCEMEKKILRQLDRIAKEGAEHCLLCGDPIPEGRQVCPKCEKEINNEN